MRYKKKTAEKKRQDFQIEILHALTDIYEKVFLRTQFKSFHYKLSFFFSELETFSFKLFLLSSFCQPKYCIKNAKSRNKEQQLQQQFKIERFCQWLKRRTAL